TRGLHVRGRMRPNAADDPAIERYSVTTDYFRLLGVPLVAGRLLDAADRAEATPVMLVSAATARQVFGTDSPLGAQVRVGGADGGPWRTVVGVVGDVHHADLTAPPTAALYLPQAQFTDSYLVLVVKSGGVDPQRLLPAIRAAVRDLDPGVPLYQPATMSDLVAKTVAERRFVMRLLAAFAAIAVLLAAVGLYGVVAYGVAQRAREMGIRVALGARRADVLRAVAGSGLAMVAAGMAAGITAAAAMTRFLGGLVFGVSSADPPSFAAAAAVLLLVAVAAH
ncbi:MAG TPA: ABC transporter permease, partial [Thermoanaerobaculia bacterium]|nr:ABC transporter permease [Thermoanaerobaculia bacterium]